MDNTALLLLLSIVTLIAVMIYVFLYPYYPIRPIHHRQSYPVMPQFGPYWSHGGQSNSGLLY